MVMLSVGAVILVPFPFSDLSQAKLRPAVVLAEAGKNDWILCQITSNPYGDAKAITLLNSSFQNGSRSFVPLWQFSWQFVMRALPSPGDNENLCFQETAHQLPVFFIINPLVYLGALVPWWLFS